MRKVMMATLIALMTMFSGTALAADGLKNENGQRAQKEVQQPRKVQKQTAETGEAIIRVKLADELDWNLSLGVYVYYWTANGGGFVACTQDGDWWQTVLNADEVVGFLINNSDQWIGKQTEDILDVHSGCWLVAPSDNSWKASLLGISCGDEEPACYLKMRLMDTYADGWESAAVEVLQGDVSSSYTISSYSASVELDVPYYANGEPMQFIWWNGTCCEDEHSFSVYAPNGVLLYGFSADQTAGDGAVLHTITESPCTNEENPYIIEHVTATSEDGVLWTFEWDAVEGISNYNVQLLNSAGRQVVNTYIQATSCNYDATNNWNAGTFTISVTAATIDNIPLTLATTTTFEVILPTLGEMTIGVRIPQASGLDTSEGVLLLYYGSNGENRTLYEPEIEDNWYRWSINPTSNAIYCYIIAPSGNETHRTYDYYIYRTEGDVCMEVERLDWSNEEYYYYSTIAIDCDAPEYNYTPFNGVMEITEDNLVSCSWEAIDVAPIHIIWVYDEQGNHISTKYVYDNETSIVFSLGNVEPLTIGAWEIQAVNENWNYVGQRVHYEVSLQVNPVMSGYPDVEITNNDDNTVTLSWEHIDGVWEYEVDFYDDFGNFLFYSYAFDSSVDENNRVQVTSSSFTTSATYQYRIVFYKEHYLLLASMYGTFDVEIKSVGDVSIRVLVPSDCGMDITNGVWMNYNEHWVEMEAEGGRWYKADVTVAEGALNLYIANGDNIIATKRTYTQSGIANDTCLQVYQYPFDQYASLQLTSCDLVDHNLAVKNQQVIVEAGKATFSFERVDATQTADSYHISLSNGYSYSVNDETLTRTIYFENTEDETFDYWYVWAYNAQDTYTYIVYSELQDGFTVPANTDWLEDLQVKDNEDGTYEVSWIWTGTQAPAYQDIRLLNPQGTSSWYDDFTYQEDGRWYWTTPLLTQEGDYSIRIYAYDEDWNIQHYIDGVIEDVVPPSLGEVTMRVLVASDCNIQLPEQTLYLVLTTNEMTDEVFPMQTEDGVWYNITFNVESATFDFALSNTSTGDYTTYYYSGLTYNEMCLEIGYKVSDDDYWRLYWAECDAPDHDYRPTNLQATLQEDGFLHLTWDAKDVADYYYVKLYVECDKSYYYEYYDSYNKELTDIVLDATDFCEWEVIPYDEYGRQLAEAGIGQGFSVPDSPYNPQNLHVETTDNHAFHFSWDTVEGADSYLVQAWDDTHYYRLYQQVTETSVEATFDIAGNYYWRVYTIKNGSYAGRTYGEDFVVTNEIDYTPTNMQRVVNKNVVTFSWETLADLTHIVVEKVDENTSETVVNEYIDGSQNTLEQLFAAGYYTWYLIPCVIMDIELDGETWTWYQPITDAVYGEAFFIEDEPTTLSNTFDNTYRITVRERDILMEATHPTDMSVYTLTGQTVTTAMAVMQAETTAPTAGIYIIRMGDSVQKVIVR